MSMDGMTMEDKCERLEPSGVMNELDDATTDCVQCAQCCMVRLSACVPSFMLLSTMVSPLLELCLSSYTLSRTNDYDKWLRKFLYQEVLYLQ